MEEPWVTAREGLDENDVSRNVMDDKSICDYFKRMDNAFNLKTSGRIFYM